MAIKKRITIKTGHHTEMFNITPAIRQTVAESGIQDGICVVDTHLVIQAVNPMMERCYAQENDSIRRRGGKLYFGVEDVLDDLSSRFRLFIVRLILVFFFIISSKYPRKPLGRKKITSIMIIPRTSAQ